MKNTQAVLFNLITFFTGMASASIFITHSQTYKVTIPIVLILLFVKIVLYAETKK